MTRPMRIRHSGVPGSAWFTASIELANDRHVRLVLEIPVAEWRARTALLSHRGVDVRVLQLFVELEHRLERCPLLACDGRILAARMTLKRTFVSACICLNS